VENKRNLLVTLADKNYIQQAKQLFSSVYWNAGWEGDYLLLAHEIPEDELEWFTDKGILVKKCKPLFDQKTGAFNYPPVIFDKFYLFTPEFKKWKNIVFLDSDIIVQASLERLTKIKYFAAAQDFYWNKLDTQFNDPLNIRFNNLTFDLNVAAFNSGVMSFNTEIITDSTFNELNNFLKNHLSDFKYPEQAVFNLYFYKRWKKLPLIFNTFIAYHHLELPIKLKFIILHFIRYPDYPSLWDPKNSFYKEWKTNLEKADFIDLNKIQKAKRLNLFEIRFNSILLLLYFYLRPYRYIIPKLRYCFFYILNSPCRLIGKTGNFIKKINPDFYNKLRKIKGGK